MANLYDDRARDLDRPLRAHYYTEIRRHAVDLVIRAAEEAKGGGDADEKLDDMVAEEADRLVIYTADAMYAYFESDNRDVAWDEGLMEGVSVADDTSWLTRAAFQAIRQDLWDAVHTFGGTVAEAHAAILRERRAFPRQAPQGASSRGGKKKPSSKKASDTKGKRR